MRKLWSLVAAAALGGLAMAATPASASPLASGVLNGSAALPSLEEGLVQKVHGWHCRKKKGWYHGHRRWHRHWRACEDYDYSYYRRPYYYDPYPRYYGLGGPFLSFQFGNRRHRHHHWDDDWNW